VHAVGRGLGVLAGVLRPASDLLGAFGDRLPDALGGLLDALANLLRALEDLVCGLGRLGRGFPGAGDHERGGQDEAKASLASGGCVRPCWHDGHLSRAVNPT
jgi:hypothetical protein